MERSTKKDKSGYYLTGDGIYGDWGVPEKFRGADVDRISAYENTGYKPTEIKSLEAEWNACRLALDSFRFIGTVEEFRALKEAERRRQDGCTYCSRKCNTCFWGEVMTDRVRCDSCEADDKWEPAHSYCNECGRDLKGESQND